MQTEIKVGTKLDVIFESGPDKTGTVVEIRKRAIGEMVFVQTAGSSRKTQVVQGIDGKWYVAGPH